MLSLASKEKLSNVRTVMARYAPDEIEDLETLIDLGQVKIRTRLKSER